MVIKGCLFKFRFQPLDRKRLIDYIIINYDQGCKDFGIWLKQFVSLETPKQLEHYEDTHFPFAKNFDQIEPVLITTFSTYLVCAK